MNITCLIYRLNKKERKKEQEEGVRNSAVAHDFFDFFFYNYYFVLGLQDAIVIYVSDEELCKMHVVSRWSLAKLLTKRETFEIKEKIITGRAKLHVTITLCK